MRLLQEKSACCGAKIVRFGGKRRRCTACMRTWSVHQAKRGPKRKRVQPNYLKHVFTDHLKVKHLALHSRLTLDAVYKRFANNLDRATKNKRIVRVRGDNLIIVLDAEWQYFRKKLWTIYIITVKAVGSNRVTVLDPLLLPGKESAGDWRQAFDRLPLNIRKRVIAIVSDGIRGIEGIASENGWVLQRCHFHLLSLLQKMRGKRSSTPGRAVREEIYDSVRLMLADDSKWRMRRLRKRLLYLINDEHCPKRMRMIVKEFLRKLPDFRSYLRHPEMKLPKTTNVVESVNSLNRRTATTIRTPESWLKWTTACARLKSKFTCK